MKIEVLNTIKKKGDKWEYNGRFYWSGKWIPVIGSVVDYKTEAQTKKAIIQKIKQQAEKYKNEQDIPQEKILALDNVFKELVS